MENAAVLLKRLREQASPALSIRKLADAVGMAASSYAFYEDVRKFKKRYLPVELAASLVKPMAEHGVASESVMALAGIEEGQRSIGDDESGAVEKLDLVAIAEIDQDYGMGGSFTSDYIEEQIHHFPRVWVESITASPPSLLTITRGRGDSMDPTIRDRDMVIIDRSRRRLDEQDAIWALAVGEIGMLKRLRARGQTIIIQSDNDRVKDEEVDSSEVTLVGRVVFIGRRT